MIAEVALNLPLRRTFDYRLPPAQAERIGPGSRVIVPFGSRVRAGVVVGLKERSELPEARLKDVQRATDAAALFPPELLEFTRWVADYYFCGWGEVLEAALPSGLGVRFRSRFRWRAGAAPAPDDPALAGLAPGLRTALCALEEWDAGQWARLAPQPADERWLGRQVRPEGLLSLHHEYAGTKARPRTERWVRLAGAGPPPHPGRRNAKRETRREHVLRLLREEGPQPMGHLRALMSGPGAVVRQLAAEGLVALEARPGERRPRVPAAPMPPSEPFLELNAGQAAAAEALRAALGQGGYRGFLLEGVTGSGKTEVYLHAVREARALGRSCLVLVPEIALTAAMVDRFRSRFRDDVAVLHSGMGEGERFDEWSRVREGRARIVIGARSAVFAPLERLGLVVVDEEHDGSYKQDESPRYHGRDAALYRASRAGAVAVLGSATPSLEALRNVALGKLTRLELPLRVQERPLPPVEMLDLRTTPRQPGCALFTKPLVDALRETLARGEQAILFLNRRGYASLARCGACGEVLLCAQCSISLTYHKADGRLLCHRCDYSQALPERCPACDAAAIAVVGLGTERIEQDVGVMFPQARVLRMDSDTLRRRGELERMMDAIRARRYDIIIGTQVLSKGHDFPYITLVGAVLADVSLNIADFRAPERTFQILTQMAGRAGRGERPGHVLIQTYSPAHYALVHVQTHDARAFAAEEAALREASGSPPYASQALVWVSSPEQGPAERLAGLLAKRLRDAAQGRGVVRVLGAAEAPIRRLAGRYRWMIGLRAATVAPIHRALHAVLDDPALRIGAKERVAVDVDPYNLL
jgi:primosomal protein N' (replication factor Y) (superfamily II helicase)